MLGASERDCFIGVQDKVKFMLLQSVFFFSFSEIHLYRDAARLPAQSCLTLCNPRDCSPPGSSVHGIFQTRILDWVAISFSRGSSASRDPTCILCTSALAGRFFTTVPPGKPSVLIYIDMLQGSVLHPLFLSPTVLFWVISSISVV